MAFAHPILESTFFVLLATWTVLGILFALPLRRLRRQLDRFNHGLWFANWTVFGSGRDRAQICVYPLEYRDVSGGVPGEWVEVLGGRPWMWHACLWQPQRRVADRIHRIGQDIAHLADRGIPAEVWMRGRREMLEHYLADTCLGPVGEVREVRLRMRRSVIDSTGGRARADWGRACFEERELLRFSMKGGDHAR